MRKIKIHDKFQDIAKSYEILFIARLEEAKRNNISPPFSVEELNLVLKDLKTGKCKDTDNYIFELFKDGVVGTELRKSLIPLLNRMKNAIKIP